MKKVKISLIAVCSLSMLLMSAPKEGYAITNAEIDRQLQQIQKKEAETAKKQQEADKLKLDIAARKEQEASSIQELWKQIEEQGDKLNQIQKQIDTSAAHLMKTTEELQEAEQRVETRDQLLKSRVRLMYTNGFVSYMDVLLESTSFSDFLDRYHALKSIVSQDKDILEANKRDREAVAQKKVQVENQLEEIRLLYAENEKIKNALVVKEKDKEVLIASLAKQEKDLEHISEEAEAQLNNLAKEKSKLWAERNKNNSKQTFVYSGGTLSWPLPGRTTISSGYGYRVDPINKSDANHKGIDIPAPAGTHIQAAEAGTVIIAQWVNGYGNTVVIDHGGGLQTWYGHSRKLLVEEGDQVKRGQSIAEVGSTGRSTGNHLHFEVRKNNAPADPLPYLKK
ncbi:murein hydrolase activator EnvC family protein [Paenibacillus sp. GCM10012303]|uniref:murein hydrolase activator EnvC family protein n=1 Tax=Paenibacillus sp. GCM10012303 TaxID=3317340 RepID=UPI0036149585